MVDTKCNFSNGKYKKTECNATNSSVPDEDESILRQPLQTSCVGFWEAKKAYENGTDEVRRLLMQECSLIYECNVCRNMFRSLANFISHKRNYCKLKFADNFHSFPENNTSVIIQTVERPNPWLAKSRSTGSSPIPGTKSSSRDLSKVIERLKRVEVTSDSGNNIHNFVMENKMTTSPKPKAPDPVLELELVSTTPNAVYQTLKTQNDVGSIKTELDEVHNLLTNQKTLLGPDGKAIINPSLISSFNSPTLSGNSDQNDNKNKVTNSLSTILCEFCKLPFQTEKTLRIHVQKKHTSTTYVFQCPTCSMTFLQPAAVIRHLANEHKKPLRRIRKMRDSILKKRIQIGDVQVKGPSRELKRLKLDNTKDIDESNIVDQQDGKPVTSCTYCCKNFERRAVLATHLTNCLVRKKTLEKKKISEGSNKITVSNIMFNESDQNQSINLNLLCNNQNADNKSTKIYNNSINIKQEPQDTEITTNNSNINEMFESLESQTFGNGLKTVSLEKLEIMVKSKANNKKEVTKGKPNEKRNVMKKDKAKRFRIVPAAKQLTCRCKICNKQFNALSNLRRHISMFHYRSRRFGCSLCEYRAFRRYDIVNHLTFVHKMTGERESMAVEYVTVHEMKYSKYDVDGDIVVVNEEAIVVEKSEKQEMEDDKELLSETSSQIQETPLKTYEKKEKRKKLILQTDADHVQPPTVDTSVTPKEVSHLKVVRRKLKKTLEQKAESQKRPIRNRIKTVNKDFVYDLLTIKEEPKQQSRLALKRRNTIFVDQKNVKILALTPPIKITPYLLRTEPLMPADKNSVKGHAANVYRNAVHEGLASPSTLPEMPTERPQMRSRLISSSRNDTNMVPVIETTELEAARLKSTLFDDSFLDKFAKTSNPSFKMKPLLALQHSPLNSILQKFDTTQQQNNNNSILRTDDGGVNFIKPTEKVITAATDIPSMTSLHTPMELTQQEINITPNGKQIIEPPSPPSTPKKRITLMQRLVENRAKRKDNIIRAALEN